ncbi:MAG: carbohydrate ABC transporter permease [Lachnospiraceae bacterium]|nr:carbohydrate ABC transporter permease [Lachnospiraceae bacterium]
MSQAQTVRKKNRKKLKITTVITHIVLLVCSLIWIYPMVWTIMSSLKPQNEFFKSQLSLFPSTFTLENFTRVWLRASFATYFLNSVIVTVCSVILVLIMTNTAGYVLGRYRFFGRGLLMAVFLSSICIPLVSTLIPVYQIIRSMGLMGTRLGLILSGAGGAHVIFLLLFSSYYSTIPNELEESAKIDGCGFFKTYFSVMRPLSRPISTTVVIMESVWTWNAFQLPLILTLNNPSSRTLAVGLYAFKGENTIDWTGICAGGAIAMIPIIIIFISFQRFFINGMAGAVKG